MTSVSMLLSDVASNAYVVGNSLRFRSSASAYLNRTPSVAGNAQKFTWSGWVKRGSLSPSSGSGLTLIGAGGTAGVGLNQSLVFHSAYTINFSNDGVGSAVTSAVFRDPSAWYHVVLAVDTTQATTNNRAIVYVNGVLQSWSATNSVPLTQNQNTAFNTTTAHTMGKDSALASNYFDGYLAEVNFVDGQALTPSSFGTYDANGVWQPIKYSGSFGTNGFYLNFGNTTSTTTLGYDTSGNSNNWTTNNISLTAGTTYDSMTDSPTVSSASVANYATLNPLYALSPATPYMSAGNLQILDNSTNSVWHQTRSTIQPVSGIKWYWEITLTTLINGIANYAGVDLITDNTAPPTGGAYQLYWNTVNYAKTTNSGSNTNFTGTPTVGDIVQIAYDAVNGQIWFGKNGTYFEGNPSAGTGASYTGINTNSTAFFAAYTTTGANSGFAVNFGQRPFVYTPPTGFNALNTYNLPAVTINNGAQYMAATLYTGTNANLSLNNGTNTAIGTTFQPDLAWFKLRSGVASSNLIDAVRGVQQTLSSDLTAAEATSTSTSGLLSFASTGLNLGTNISTTGSTNGAGGTYVAWQWKAAGSTASNTNGSITSTVSANTTAGFSVVTYTGTGVAAATVGHGLGVAPQFIITKMRSSSVASWNCWHTGINTNQVIYLNSTSAAATPGTGINWNPTSTTFRVDPDGGFGSNASGVTQVAYCFAAVSGYSAFGSYTGNGSADGPFVYTGFRPRFVLFKRTDAVNTWLIYDTSRSPYNADVAALYPNTSAAETTDDPIDYLSNGFKMRGTGNLANTSGGTYIYAAFAENPFNSSRAR